ncbi:MAG: hypothetical protein CMK07_16700 [Ponticaulis sp.]|nr:hypothetical protein [Ponticaulis sp.]
MLFRPGRKARFQFSKTDLKKVDEMNAPISAATTTLLPWRDAEFRMNPFPWYDTLRKQAPVYKDPTEENTYIVSRYEDVVAFGRHPSLTMKAPSWVDKGAWGLFKDCIIVRDPPEHTALRRRSNKWFTPKMANQWAEASAEAVGKVIDELGPQGNVEAYRNLALIPAHHAMCKALGLPNDGYDTASAYMMDCMIALGSDVTPAEADRCQTAFDYLQDRVTQYLDMRRETPSEGMVSSWLDLVAKGEMTPTQLNDGVMLFWATGTPNAAYLITGGLEIFARKPEVFDLWRSEPSQRKAILDEVARLHTAEMSFDRFTTEPLDINGQIIPAGMHVRFMIASANRQPELFEDPHEFRLDRSADTPPHLSFGIGPHSCPGMVIAQAEAHAVFNLLTERLTRVELAGAPIYGHDDRSARYRRLPLRLVA